MKSGGQRTGRSRLIHVMPARRPRSDHGTTRTVLRFMARFGNACSRAYPSQCRASPRKASCLAPAKRLAGPMTSDHLAVNAITRRVREFAERVRRVQDRDLYLYLQPVEAIGGPRVTIGGRSVLLGSSYSYLGLLGHPEIEAAARAAMQQYGTRTSGVRLLAGQNDPHPPPREPPPALPVRRT